MCLSDQSSAPAGKSTRGRNNPQVVGIDGSELWINRTGRFNLKARDSSEEARAHRGSRKRVETCEVQASLTLPSSRIAADARQPTSQISTGQESGTLAARANTGRS